MKDDEEDGSDCMNMRDIHINMRRRTMDMTSKDDDVDGYDIGRRSFANNF